MAVSRKRKIKIAAGDMGTAGDYIGGMAYGAKLCAVKVTQCSTGNAYASDMIAGWEWCITHQHDNPDYPPEESNVLFP